MIHKPTHATITTKIRRVLFRNSDLAYMARTLLIKMRQLLAIYRTVFYKNNERVSIKYLEAICYNSHCFYLSIVLCNQF